MAYSDKVVDHYNNPRNVGYFAKDTPGAGTGLVGAPAGGDVMKLKIKVTRETGINEDAKSDGGRADGSGVQAGQGAQAGAEPARERVSADGSTRRRLLGYVVLAGVRHREGAARPRVRYRRREGRRGHQELSLPGRNHARLRPAGIDGRLHVREPEGEVDLWVRHVVLGVAGPLDTRLNGPTTGPF